MDWHPSHFEPNLKFASELQGDLKTKYFEHHEKVKNILKDFSCSLQNIFLKQQKLLNENIELSITNEKLRKIIDSQEFNKQIVPIIEPPSSEVLGASPNCKFQISSKLSLSKKNDLSDKSSSIVQKENVNDLPPIYSEDFDSDLDDGSFITHRSPPASVANSPVKIQSSPILSKRKKSSSRRSNSSINTSSQSLDSNNDSKVSLVNASSFDRNIEIDADLSKEFEKEYEMEPLKPIENIVQFPLQNNQEKSAPSKILNVSKTNYAKTEFLDKGKKSRQTTLCFKKVAPVVDISKVDLNDSLGNKSMILIKQENSWSNTFCETSMTNHHSDSILVNMKKLNSPRGDPKESRTRKNQNTFAKEDECIEISPVQNGRSSKLRNKLIKKTDVSNVKEKSRLPDDKFSFPTSNNNILQKKRSFENGKPEIKYEKLSLESNEPQRSISDETYFSQAEMTNHKTDMTNFDADLTEFEDDDMHSVTPPAKKILLDSFDIIPGREEKIPDYAYEERPVRKKSEKEKLQGWACRDCGEYYEILPENERKEHQNKCSKHRGNRNPERAETPPSFWNPYINGTQDDSHDESTIFKN